MGNNMLNETNPVSPPKKRFPLTICPPSTRFLVGTAALFGALVPTACEPPPNVIAAQSGQTRAAETEKNQISRFIPPVIDKTRIEKFKKDFSGLATEVLQFLQKNYKKLPTAVQQSSIKPVVPRLAEMVDYSYSVMLPDGITLSPGEHPLVVWVVANPDPGDDSDLHQGTDIPANQTGTTKTVLVSLGFQKGETVTLLPTAFTPFDIPAAPAWINLGGSR